jgi:hypothetical protein
LGFGGCVIRIVDSGVIAIPGGGITVHICIGRGGVVRVVGDETIVTGRIVKRGWLRIVGIVVVLHGVTVLISNRGIRSTLGHRRSICRSIRQGGITPGSRLW